MAERKTLYDGLGSALCGFAFIGLDIKLGSVSILPAFVGWLMISESCSMLSEERRDFALLMPLCSLMALWTFGDWLASWFGRDLDGHILFLDLLVGAVSLYLRFQFLTDMAAIASRHYAEGREDLAPRFLKWRNVQVVVVTAISLCFTVLSCLGGDAAERANVLVMVLAVVGCAADLAVVWQLIQLRDWFREEDAPAEKQAEG